MTNGAEGGTVAGKLSQSLKGLLSAGWAPLRIFMTLATKGEVIALRSAL
jgi:hypothetical protein